ncbi:MAG: hypothetical protein KA748_14985 [Halomonas sp.]|nr:hypothetical protein [Halomonas sp.]MBP5981494.1 hypothetical protein [Halomonas sp.]
MGAKLSQRLTCLTMWTDDCHQLKNRLIEISTGGYVAVCGPLSWPQTPGEKR